MSEKGQILVLSVFGHLILSHSYLTNPIAESPYEHGLIIYELTKKNNIIRFQSSINQNNKFNNSNVTFETIFFYLSLIVVILSYIEMHSSVLWLINYFSIIFTNNLLNIYLIRFYCRRRQVGITISHFFSRCHVKILSLTLLLLYNN